RLRRPSQRGLLQRLRRSRRLPDRRALRGQARRGRRSAGRTRLRSRRVRDRARIRIDCRTHTDRPPVRTRFRPLPRTSRRPDTWHDHRSARRIPRPRRGSGTHRRQRTERTGPRIPARTRCEGDPGARELASMTAETTIVELPWWDLAEVADQDAKVFGPTAWTIRYYWSVKAQNGTAMFMARTVPTAGRGSGECGTTASAGELAGWIVMSATGAEADVMTIATTEAARGKGIG